MTEELLPCPFCGSSVEISEDEYITYEGYERWDFSINCSNKNCILPEITQSQGEEETLIKKWNTRATDKKYDKLLEFLTQCAHLYMTEKDIEDMDYEEELVKEIMIQAREILKEIGEL